MKISQMKFLITFYSLSIWITVLMARKHKKNDDSPYVPWHTNSHVNLKGNFLKTFFVLSALTTPDQNTVCSPLSAMMPLAKLALGAEGQALEELLEATGIPKKSKIRIYLKPVLIELRYLPGGKLDIVSKLYISIKSHLHRAFVENSKDIFESSVEKMDFQYPTFAAEQINSWVSSQTNYLINDIVSPVDIPATASLILVNAVYFNGRWKNPFKTLINTTFYTPRENKEVTMMTRTGYYNYTKSNALQSQIIQIPYAGEKATFVIVLPTMPNKLPILLSQLKLTPELLDSAMSKMVDTNIELTIPKFKIESALTLNDMYEKAGIKKIFRQIDSGLTKIAKDEKIFVTSAKQKAFIDVNEFGTEAGAATAVIIAELSYHKPEKFLANRPFLFFILANKHQLFSGTLINPVYV